MLFPFLNVIPRASCYSQSFHVIPSPSMSYPVLHVIPSPTCYSFHVIPSPTCYSQSFMLFPVLHVIPSPTCYSRSKCYSQGFMLFLVDVWCVPPQDVKLTASNDDYYFVFEDFLYQVGVAPLHLYILISILSRRPFKTFSSGSRLPLTGPSLKQEPKWTALYFGTRRFPFTKRVSTCSFINRTAQLWAEPPHRPAVPP